jgi:3-methyladenine DNA glycosylase AlkD
MDLKQALRELESKGKVTARKAYVRHGVTGSCFGVTSGELAGMARSIKVDHDLALGLWGSGNHDARMLATLIVDAGRLDEATAMAWLAEADNDILVDAVADAIARMPSGLSVARRLMDSDLEWPSTAAWTALAKMVMAGVVDNAFAAQLLVRAERTMGGAPNRTRHAMNGLVIAVGGYRDELREKALATASAIGVVDVNHGESGGKTPDAAVAIGKLAAGEKSKAAKAFKAANPKLKGR